jgi:branched-chain amino acid transport system substrate-binding protein
MTFRADVPARTRPSVPKPTTRPFRQVAASIFRVLAVGCLAASGLLVVSAAADATTPKPIVVGDICSCTGPEASTIGQTTAILNAWVKWTNAHGGIMGHPVQLEFKDDAYNPSTSLSEVKGMVRGGAIAIMDNSDVDPAWASYVKSAHVPVLGDTETEAGYTNSDFFTPGATFNHVFNGGVALALEKKHIKKVAYLYCAEVAICTQAKDDFAKSLPSVGIQLTYSAAISSSEPSYAAVCLAAKQSGAKGMVVGDASGVVTKVVQDCAAQGYTPIQFGNDGTVSKSWLTVPAFDNNVDLQSNLPWFVKNSSTKTMYAALAKYAPGVVSSPNFGAVAAQNWAMTVELQQAAQLGHIGSTPTAASLVKGLYAFHGNTLNGLSPPLTFHKGKPADNGCYFLMGIGGRKFTTPYGLKTFCVATTS